MSASMERLGRDGSRRYWFRWTDRPEGVGWSVQVDHLDRPLTDGGYQSRLVGGGIADSAEQARREAQDAVDRSRL